MLLNAAWGGGGAPAGRAATLAASFESVYCFEPIAVRVRQRRASNSLWRRRVGVRQHGRGLMSLRVAVKMLSWQGKVSWVIVATVSSPDSLSLMRIGLLIDTTKQCRAYRE